MSEFSKIVSNHITLEFIGQAKHPKVVEKELCTNENQIQSMENGTEKSTTNENIDHMQVHPDLQIVEGEKHMPTERTWQDMWPKNDKQQHDDDENANGAECKEGTQEEIEETAKQNEKERTWNDMWP